MNFKAFRPIAGVALALAAGLAQAGTATFDLPLGKNGKPDRPLLGRNLGTSYAEDGLTFSAATLLRNPLRLLDADPTGETLSDPFGSPLNVARTDGSTFDLVSLDLADLLNFGFSPTVVLTWVVDGASFTRNLTLDGKSGLETFSLGYDDVSSFKLSGGSFQLDNVVTTDYVAPPSAVPEPGSVTLLQAGLGLLATVARRRKA